MKKELLLEGAVAGHMNHIYDNGEMTFGELKQLLQAVSDGKVRGTEKTDGQNIFLSFDVRTQKAKAIRNKSHIKAGGLDIEAFDDFFSDHPSQALRHSFVEALGAFEQVIKNLDKGVQEKIFGPGNDETDIYFNTEVMNPGIPDLEEDDPRGAGTTNVIPYDKKTLLIHRVGHSMFTRETAKVVKDESGASIDITPNYDILEQSISGMSTDDPSVFSVETNPIRRLDPIKDKDITKDAISEINNLIRDQGLNDNDTINDYVIAQVKPEIENLGLTEDRNEMILQRVMEMPGKPTSTQITKGLPAEIKSDISEYIKNFKYASYTRSLQLILHDFSVSAVDGLESAFISDNKKQIKFLQDELSDTIKKINNSSNEAAKQELVKQMEKLKSPQGINTPSEGFVFDWNGVTYKLTGNFAPANQILGMERFQRFGPIEPQESDKEASNTSSTGLKIALFPGSFKPPHKGHVLAAQELAKDADIIYILVSAPQLSGRALKSGGTISADQAIQCWNAMIDQSPLKNKARVMIGPEGVASPMMTAINYIQHPAAPDNIYAAPENATVILGVGAKGSDADRYGERILAKSKENRPDLTIIKKAVGPFEHSQEYLNLLQKHPSIAGMLNKGKGRVSPDELSEEERLEGRVADKQLYHASDMRDFIDLAAEDPIGLEFLKHFVILPEDAIAVMGILGINAADQRDSESDQVVEPELDALESDTIDESLAELVDTISEAFKNQKAPKGKPDSGIFQRNMKRRLSKAHAVYLDMGRKDLTKHGGGFHLDRPKDISNAFLAEEDIEEASGLGNVGPMGHVDSTVRKPSPKRNDKKMKKEEQQLRLQIRKGLKEFFKFKRKENINLINEVIQEHQLRLHLRKIIFSESLNLYEAEEPTTDVHDNTGINTLKDMMYNTNVLSTLREVYKSLTTDEGQKKSFRAHIVKWTQDTLATVRLNDTTEQVSEQNDLGIDIEGINNEKFIDAKDGSEADIPKEDPEEEKMKPISGEDTTGRNKAERVYPIIEKSIIKYYAELDNAEDQEMFYDYLIANLKLYFDKWDSESDETIEEPTNDEYEQAKDAI
tara:strand:- start:11089 stop:14289 length:3201 start_codon:yes stop_codon:yes gene_type:complete